MKEFFRKFGSRKFLVCLAGLITGLAVAFGADGETVSALGGVVTSLVSLVTYIITEGKVDAAAVKKTEEEILKAAELLALQGKEEEK